MLSNGRQSYREFLAMVGSGAQRTHVDLCQLCAFPGIWRIERLQPVFWKPSLPLIRPNQYGPLSSDAPNRGLFWGVIGLPHKLDFLPILDVHTGFPFSRLDQNWNYLGPENQAGRFRTFLALDTKLQYPVDFKFHGHRFDFVPE